MRPLLLLISLLLLPWFGYAQGFADLSGEVSKVTADSISVSWRAQPFDAHDQVVAVRLDRHGAFHLRVPLVGPTAARLVYSNEDTPLFLEPGDMMRVRFRAEDMPTTLKFLPADGPAYKQALAANNYLAAFETAFTDNEGYQVLPENIQLYEKPYLSFLEYRRKHEYELLHEHEKGDGFSPAFAAYAKAEIEYSYANDRLSYADLREQVVASGNRIQLSGDYYDFLHNPDLVPGVADTPASDQCEDFMLNYVHYQTQANGTPSTAPGYYVACYKLARQQLRGALQLAVLGQLLAETFRFGHVDHSTALLADFATTGPPAWVAELRQDFAEHKAMAIGAPAPPLPLRTASGDSVKVQSYPGKLVYIMFWDSRLALCQRELPFLKDEAEHQAEQPMVFLTVALDENEAAWQRSVAAQPPAGIAAWVPAGSHTDVRTAYDIQQLPTFLVLDEQGKILDPRPKRLSSRALQDDLKNYLGRAAAYRAVPLPKPGK